MPTPTFTWNAVIGAEHSCKAGVNTVKFGDGYEARFPLGINNLPKVWSLTFEDSQTVIQNILAFLRARGGVEKFQWTDPLNETSNYVCGEWKTTRIGFGAYRLTCSFKQVFEA